MSRQQAAAILEAADRWKQRCLLDGGSLFTDERLWTREHFDQLRVHFVENPDAGSGSFYEKLRRQLDPASPQAKRLWAEMTWAFFLIARNVTPETKSDQIRRVWEWSGSPLPEDHWALREDVLTGCSNVSAGFLPHRWRELRFVVSAMLDWFSSSRHERGMLSTDPWGFAEWLAGRRFVQGRQFRHALLFLLFPDSFEPILVGSRKREIVKGFARRWGEELPADGDDIAIDRTLLKIRERLAADRPGEEVDFYRPPFADVWRTGSEHPQPPPSPGDPLPRPNGDDDEAWFRKRFGDEAAVWVIAPGSGARRWPDFLQHGMAAIDYDELGDLSEYASREAIHQAAVESGLGENPYNRSLAMWNFAHAMQVGDVLIAKRGGSAVLGWGRVQGDYLYDPDRSDWQHLRKVEWHPSRKPVELARAERIALKALTREPDGTECAHSRGQGSWTGIPDRAQFLRAW